MFGPVSKSVVAGITNLLAILGYVADLSLVHGQLAIAVVVAIAVLHLALNVYAVWSVPNSSLQAKVESTIADVKATVQTVKLETEPDPHAGVAATVTAWPTAPSPITPA